MHNPIQSLKKIQTELHRASGSRLSQKAPTAVNISAIPISPTGEAKKSIIAKNTSSLLNWHFWVIVPCLTTAVLLFLNLSEYVIGTEIGKTPEQTKNILGMLQVAAKAHEITIMIGLISITQQWIQGCLIGGGTMLGLLGAEQSLGKISFLISKEFIAAIGYGLNGLTCRGKQQAPKERRRRRNVLLLAAFILIGCLLCAVVGPASAVLMIPQLNWFYESYRVNDVTTELKSESGVTRYPVCYPYIMIDPRLGGGQYPANPFNSAPEPQYWSHAWFLKVLQDKFHTDEIHKFSEDGVPTTVNTTTTWDRPLTVGADWKGATNFSSVIFWDVITTSTALEEYAPVSKNTGSKTQFVANLTGIEANTVCRRRQKQSCGTQPTASSNSSEWCYLTVSKDTDEGILQSSKNLLLVVDHIPDKDMEVARPRFWMTEGLRMTTSPKFTDSIVFVFEEALRPETPEQLLTVCSTSITLKSVTASSADQRFSAEKAQFHDYLAYFDGSSTRYVSPRTLLYHENWLDQIHEDVPDVANQSSPTQTRNVTYSPRSEQKPTENTYLKAWATEVLNSNTHTGSPIWEPIPGGIEAGIVETVIGGAYITVLLRMQASDSQYSTSYIPRRFIRSGAVETYPQSLLPEAMLDYTSYKYPPIKIYRLVYGYRPLSAVGISSIVILIVHSLIALLGSLWQYQKGGVIRAWSTIPQYGALCLGTNPVLGAIENTCAGIEAKDTLRTFVKIGETRVDHLELAVVSPSLLPGDVKRIDLSKNYGFLGAMGRRKEKLE